MCIRTLFLFTVIFIVCCVTIGNAVRDLIDPREVDCLAKNLYFEARQESTAGKIAVGFVVLTGNILGCSPTQYVALFIKGGTMQEEFLILIGVSLVGIVMGGVTILLMLLLSGI